MDTTKVTRIAVIDDKGRSYVYTEAASVTAQLQDQDRTLKIFVNCATDINAPKPSAFNIDIDKARQLPNEVLAHAYVLLYGEDWKMGWSDKSKAYEMRSILDGGCQPCAPFEKWVEVVGFIMSQID